MRIENIKPAAVPAYINNQENYEYMELESRANKTAAVLLTLSGLATLGLVGAGFMYNRKSGLKTFNETVKNKGIKYTDLANSIKNQFVMLKGIKAGFDAPKRISMNAF